eukprot:gnl/TRDRNA2_/TRDRNA2_131429_c0_seq1.p1 gnl/TRDRNA2_/TRDRNA2_131429_c0~~gnl/TRDRNA2_/TRDRNA2_131429_c0_seq1.p1  ORF type:complete len:383 (-),score=68.43 gnl/TRDRNA2_/TRDRNA2_131429_c0_seq1:35-1183(-)
MQWSLALSLLESMSKGRAPPGVLEEGYELVAHELMRNGQAEGALKLLDEVEAEGFSMEKYSFVVRDALELRESSGDWQSALELLASMERRAMPRDARVFCAAIGACERASHVTMAAALIREAGNNGYGVDVLSYSAVTTTSQKTADFRPGLGDLYGDSYKFMVLMSNNPGLCERIQHLAAMSLQEPADSVAAQHSHPMQMIGRLVKPPGADSSHRVLMASEHGRGVPAKRHADSEEYASLLRSHAESLSWEKALATIDGMWKAGLTPGVRMYDAAIRSFRKGGPWLQACALLRSMWEWMIFPDVEVYNATLFACQDSKQWFAALELLVQMVERHIMPNAGSYGEESNAQPEAEQPAERDKRQSEQGCPPGCDPDACYFFLKR